MQRWFWKLGPVPIALSAWALLICAGNTYDYGLQCTRCLREYHVVQLRLWQIPFYQTKTVQFAGYDLESITGKPCEHIYRRTGFGESWALGLIGDGMTGEGSFFRMRSYALRDAFKTYQQFPDKELMRKTLNFIDACLPPDASVQDRKTYPNQIYLMFLSRSLTDVRSAQDWKAALADIQSEMAAGTFPSK